MAMFQTASRLRSRRARRLKMVRTRRTSSNKGVSIKSRIEMMKFRHRIRKLLDEYLGFGSFPKVVLIVEGKRSC